MTGTILACDLGTGGNKASLYDAGGCLLATVFVPYETRYPKPGWHEQEPGAWWDSVVQSTRQLLATGAADPRSIRGLAVSGHSLGCVPLDADGQLLRAATPIWSDKRPTAQATRFFEKIDPTRWYQLTGSEQGYVFLATTDSESLELAARSTTTGDGGQALLMRWRGPPPAESILRECVTSQRVTERTSAEGTGSLHQAGLPGTLARQLAAPILDGDRLVGVVLLANKREVYHEEDRAHTVQVTDALWKALRRRRSDTEIVSAMDHMERVMLGAIEAIGTLSEAQDGCRTGRSRRVAELSAAIGTAMGLPGHAVRGLRVIGQLIDVGMLHIPREILWRPAPLGAAEFELVRTHADRGYEMLRHVDFPWPVAEAVRQHHERLDGSGYPRGLKGDEILLESRIVAVADSADAMLSQRPYRQALSMTACLEELQVQAGRRYDAVVVRACARLLRERQAEPEAQAGKRIA